MNFLLAALSLGVMAWAYYRLYSNGEFLTLLGPYKPWAHIALAVCAGVTILGGLSGLLALTMFGVIYAAFISGLWVGTPAGQAFIAKHKLPPPPVMKP